MSKVIKNGTIVTADRQWKADVLIEGERIAEIGEDLSGDATIDASDAYVIPGGIDPHTHLEMPFMGTTAAETFEIRHLRGRRGRDHDAGRFLPARARMARSQRHRRLGREVPRPDLLPTSQLSHGDHRLERDVSSRRWKPS